MVKRYKERPELIFPSSRVLEVFSQWTNVCVYVGCSCFYIRPCMHIQRPVVSVIILYVVVPSLYFIEPRIIVLARLEDEQGTLHTSSWAADACCIRSMLPCPSFVQLLETRTHVLMIAWQPCYRHWTILLIVHSCWSWPLVGLDDEIFSYWRGAHVAIETQGYCLPCLSVLWIF